MRVTKVGTPVASSDGQNADLGDHDSGADSGSHFLGGLDTETNVTLGVTDDDDSLETGALTGTGLLLDGFDLRFSIPLARCLYQKSSAPIPQNPTTAAPRFLQQLLSRDIHSAIKIKKSGITKVVPS